MLHAPSMQISMSPNLLVMKEDGTLLNTSATISSMTCKPECAGTWALLHLGAPWTS